MKKLTIMLWAVVLAAAIPSPTFGAIMYSGSQNVALALSPMSPPDSRVIEIGGVGDDWDDFRVDLWLEKGVGARLAIHGPANTGGVLGVDGSASKLAGGTLIGPDSSFLDLAYLYGSGKFGEGGGYVGLRTGKGQYGWLHMLSQSNTGTDTHGVIFDEWAYESEPGVPIRAGQEDSCDWVSGGVHKMHWPQSPDLSSVGMDVSVSQGTTLADDFLCTASGPISDIHMWGSFRDDVLPNEGPDSLTFELSIYSDVSGENARWGHPGHRLWTRTFQPGE